MKFALSTFLIAAASVAAQSLNFAAPYPNSTITAGEQFTVTLKYKPGQGVDNEKGILIYVSGRTPGSIPSDYYSRRGYMSPWGQPSTDDGMILYSSGSYQPEKQNGKCCSNSMNLTIPANSYANGPAILTLTRVFSVDAASTPQIAIKHLPIHLIGNNN